MNRHIVVMKSVGYVEVYGASSSKEAMEIAKTLPQSQIENTTEFFPEMAFEAGENIDSNGAAVYGQKERSGKPGRKKMEVGDIPSSFLLWFDLYQKGSITLSELARRSSISRPTAYKYAAMIQEARGGGTSA